MPIKKILWASDGSKESRDALRWAEILANQFGARVIGLSVLETLNRDALKAPADLSKEILRIECVTEKKETTRLTQVRNVLEKRGIKAEVRIAT